MKTITLENGQKVEISEESYNALAESIQVKQDYSKWIGSCSDMFAIKGENYLKSNGGDISFNAENKSSYHNTFTYEVIDISELKKGDVFIKDKCEFINTHISSFMVHIHHNSVNDSRGQYIGKRSEGEVVDWRYCSGKVKRFIRG